MGLNLDFSEDVIKPYLPPPDMYLVRLDDIEIQKKEKGDRLYLKWIIQGSDYSDFVIPDGVSLSPQSRWRLQQILEALTGKEWRASGMDLEPTELLGLFCRVAVIHEKYKGQNEKMIGRDVAVIKDYFPES